jgi:calcineurin-like phosphoesterase
MWSSGSSESKSIACLVLEIEPFRKRFLAGMPQRFEVAKDHALLHGVVIEIDNAMGKTLKIQHVSESIV